MDDIDLRILGILMEDGRITWTDLGRAVGLSAPSVMDRVKKLREAGVIARYAAIVDPRALDLRMLAFVFVSMMSTGHHDAFVNAVADLPEILECHVTAGDYDYLLKARCRDGAHLQDLMRTIRTIGGVGRTSSTITLSTPKETTALPTT